MDNKQNFYEILNLKPGASLTEIKSNFRKLVLVHHPDKNNNSQESQVLFQVIYNAYSTLISTDKRKEYDNYLKTSSVYKAGHYKSKQGIIDNDVHDKEILDYLSERFNFILWEIEDILNNIKKPYVNKVYNGLTINQWLVKIMHFIDMWVLTPSGFKDYFYEARKIKGNSHLSFNDKGSYNNYKPYINTGDYFYEIRKRMNRFIEKISIETALRNVEPFNIKIIDCILESQMLAYHYLGSINLILQHKAESINKFCYSRTFFEKDSQYLVNKNPDTE